MRIVLDTGVFYHPEALGMMPWYEPPVIVPSIVFAERSRQLAKRGADPDEFAALLQSIGATVEPLDADAAIRFTQHIHDDGKWKRLARDAMIAGHVREGDRLFTTNPRDFIEVGVSPRQIVEIPAWAERVRKRGA